MKRRFSNPEMEGSVVQGPKSGPQELREVTVSKNIEASVLQHKEPNPANNRVELRKGPHAPDENVAG